MKKILDLLEQKVEWLVLAAGVIFAGYIAWAYIIDSPVHVDLDGRRTPAEVDNVILEGPAAKLESEMHSTAPHVAIPQPHFVDSFRDSMNYAKAPTTAPSSEALVIWPHTPMIKFSDIPVGPAGPAVAGGEPAAGLGTVTQLPKVPTPQLIATRSDMSYVDMPGQQQPAQPAPVGDDAGVAAAAPPPVSLGGMDKTWASVLYTIDAVALAREWGQVHLPDANSKTIFVQVLLEREELKPDGTWSDPLPLPPLAVGVTIPPIPPGAKATPDALGYIAWAGQHQVDIIRPAFYQVRKGKKWAPPGIDTTMAQTEEKFDPTKYLDPKSDVSKLTMDQRLLVSRARKAKADEAAKSRRGSGRPSGGGAAPPPADAPAADQGPNDPDRPANFVAADPAAAANAGAPATPSPRPAGAAPTVAQLVAYPIPTGEFDPSKWPDEHPNQPLIVGWAHDETVQAGHTYRYRVTYRLKNPVWFAASAVKDPKLADQFDLRSSPSEWSGNVEVRSSIDFWLVNASDTSGIASVDVFRWQGGDPKHKIFRVSAGDMIGAKEGNIDYATGWAIVDMRKDPRSDKLYVLLMDPAGLIHRRDVDADASNAKYLELKQQSASPTAAR